jgi:glycosyltransferase involved in cell wall biosynthesis
MEKLKVSCHIITYNQNNYIRECIDGALNQETNFNYEIVIGDDNSNDGTKEILLEYQKKYPEKIRLNLREKRGVGIPGQDNFFSTMLMCKGKYIALCDGDDYWSNPLKLQKQFDFLEENKDYTFCAARCDKFHHEKNEFQNLDDEYFMDDSARQINIENFLDPYILHSNTIMFRSIIDFENLNRKGFKDIFLYALLLEKGFGICLNEKLGVYRVHNEGIWSMQNLGKLHKGNSFTCLYLKKYFGNRYKLINSFTFNTNITYLNYLYENNHQFFEKLKISLRLIFVFKFNLTIKQRIRLITRLIKNV